MGIAYAQSVTAAKEISLPEKGNAFDSLLRYREVCLDGVVYYASRSHGGYYVISSPKLVVRIPENALKGKLPPVFENVLCK